MYLCRYIGWQWRSNFCQCKRSPLYQHVRGKGKERKCTFPVPYFRGRGQKFWETSPKCHKKKTHTQKKKEEEQTSFFFASFEAVLVFKILMRCIRERERERERRSNFFTTKFRTLRTRSCCCFFSPKFFFESPPPPPSQKKNLRSIFLHLAEEVK